MELQLEAKSSKAYRLKYSKSDN